MIDIEIMARWAGYLHVGAKQAHGAVSMVLFTVLQCAPMLLRPAKAEAGAGKDLAPSLHRLKSFVLIQS